MDINPSQNREICTNRKAYYNFEILDTFEVGMQLLGTEIKSLRLFGASIQEAYISPIHGELWLINASITPYSYGSYNNHEEKRKRRLLAHKKEIQKIESAIQEKGLTCIPLAIFLKKGLAKMKIGLAKGKKLHDKREHIKTEDQKRQIQKVMRHDV